MVTPAAADAGELATWDLTALDAGPKPPSPPPPPPAPDPLLYRGDSCTFIVQLFVTDNSAINDDSSTHYTYHQVPVKIVNDLQ